MKKILVVCDEYAYTYNGDFYLRKFGHELISRYLDVFDSVRFVVRTKAVTNKNDLGVYNEAVNNKNIEIYPISFFQGPKEYLKNYMKVKKELDNSIVNCDGAVLRIPSTVAFACLKLIKETKIPYVVEVVANPIELLQSSSNIPAKFFLTVMHFQQMKACKDANGASYVTEYALQKIYPIAKKNSFEEHYSSVSLKDSFFSAPRTYSSVLPFVICHVAHPIKTHNKGHLTVMRVIKELTLRGYDVIGKFAGDGDLVPFFKQEAEKMGIADKIEFSGLLKQQELREFLISSHLMLFPTVSEGLPRAVIEGMATGLPCLSCPVGGIPELLNEDLLYSYRDIKGFTNKIIELIDDAGIYEKKSEIAYAKAKEYSADILQNRRIIFFNKFKQLL